MVLLPFQSTADQSPPRRGGLDRQFSSNRISPVLHDPHAQPPRPRRGVDGNARSIVADGQRHPTAGSRQDNRDFFRLAMLDGIVHRLLRDSEEVRGNLIVANLYFTIALESAVDPRALPSRQRQLLERR